MEVLRLSTEGWSREDVLHPHGFVERWRGLRGLGADSSMLFETGSVHSLGMGRGFVAVGLDASYRVTGLRLVRPWRVAVFPGCRYVLELPLDSPSPRVGQTIEVFHV